MYKQKGMSFIGMLLTTIIVVLLGISVIRIVPVYIQHYSVVSSIKALSKLDPSTLTISQEMNVTLLKKKLENQLYVNEVDELVKEGIKIKPKGQRDYLVTLDYKTSRPLFYNISLLFTFKDQIEVHIGSS